MKINHLALLLGLFIAGTVLGSGSCSSSEVWDVSPCDSSDELGGSRAVPSSGDGIKELGKEDIGPLQQAPQDQSGSVFTGTPCGRYAVMDDSASLVWSMEHGGGLEHQKGFVGQSVQALRSAAIKLICTGGPIKLPEAVALIECAKKVPGYEKVLYEQHQAFYLHYLNAYAACMKYDHTAEKDYLCKALFSAHKAGDDSIAYVLCDEAHARLEVLTKSERL